MESCLDIASIEMDYGVLHDQRCTTVVCRDNTMTFTFDIHLCPDDYAEDVYKKYQPYSRCDMLVEMTEEPFHYFLLETAVGRNNQYHGLSLGRTAFLDVANHADAITFLSCGVDAACREFHILFGISFRQRKRAYRKFRKYGMCRVELSAKRVQWKWY